MSNSPYPNGGSVSAEIGAISQFSARNVSVGGAIQVPTPVNPTDATNKAYVDAGDAASNAYADAGDDAILDALAWKSYTITATALNNTAAVTTDVALWRQTTTGLQVTEIFVRLRSTAGVAANSTSYEINLPPGVTPMHFGLASYPVCSGQAENVLDFALSITAGTAVGGGNTVRFNFLPYGVSASTQRGVAAHLILRTS